MREDNQSREVPTEVYQRERRQWTRFGADQQYEMVGLEFESGETHEGRLFDESFDGIGVLVDNGEIYRVGQQLELTYRDVRVGAVVRHIATRSDSATRVGLQLRLTRPLTGADDDWRIGLFWGRRTTNDT